MQFSKYGHLMPFEAPCSSWDFCMGWEKPCVCWRDKQKPGNVVMHQNQYEIVMFRQWGVLCQIQFRQQFSWLNASVCWSITGITLIPLTRPLSAGRAWIFTSYEYTHTKILRWQCLYLKLNPLLALSFKSLTKRSKMILGFLYCGFQCSYMLKDT